jgi:hypothetical protein
MIGFPLNLASIPKEHFSPCNIEKYWLEFWILNFVFIVGLFSKGALVSKGVLWPL